MSKWLKFVLFMISWALGILILQLFSGELNAKEFTKELIQAGFAVGAFVLIWGE